MIDTTFLGELASSSPTPGGGGASAYCGALAASLSSMVGNLTVGKARYAEVEPEVMGALGRLAILRSRLVSLIDEDAAAFAPLAAAYAMPKSTPVEVAAKDEAMQEALAGACDVPLSIMQSCMDVLKECEFLAHNGSRLAVSDAGASAVMAKAAMEAASLNVYININSMADALLAGHYRQAVDMLLEEGRVLADDIYEYVKDQIGTS